MCSWLFSSQSLDEMGMVISGKTSDIKKQNKKKKLSQNIMWKERTSHLMPLNQGCLST